MSVLINNFVYELSNRYNYDEELSAFLSQVISIFVDFFGDNFINQIFDALLNCEIHYQEKNESAQEYFFNYFGVDDVHLSLFSSGAYIRRFYLNENVILEKELIYLYNDFNKEKFDLNNQNNKAVLIHELIHLITSHNRFKFDDDRLISYSGLSKKISKYNPLKCTFEQVLLNYHMIDEAVNSYIEARIMNILLNKYYDVKSGYKNICECINFIASSDIELFWTILDNKKYGVSDWIDIVGEDTSLIIDKLFNEIFDFSRNRSKYGLDDIKKRKKILLDSITKFEEIIINLSSKRKCI